MLRIAIATAACVCGTVTLVAAAPAAVQGSALAAPELGLNPFNEAYRTRIRSLCQTYEWAQSQRQNILAHCDFWMGLPDAELRIAVPSQMVPRSLYLNQKAGCPNCGVEIFRHGYYPWLMNPKEHPWKLQCPVCKAWFPKNDFAAYHRSGLDERLMFRPERADASLLFNAEHPEPNDPLHRYAVDPGTGYQDKEKGSFKFVAHYNHHANWGANARYPGSAHSIPSAAVGLGYGYAITGDLRYAHKAAVLLDRLADVYPELDFEYWASRGGYHQYRGIYGTAVDSTWSTRVAYDLVRAYALVRDAIEADRALVDKIERSILRETFEKQKQSVIWGNTGFNEDVALMLVLASRDDALRAELVAWLFSNAAGEPIPSPHSDWRRTRPGGGLGRTVAALTTDGSPGKAAWLLRHSALFLTQAYPSLRRLLRQERPEVRTTMELLRQRLPAFYRSSFRWSALTVSCRPGRRRRFGVPMVPKGAQDATCSGPLRAGGRGDRRLYWRMRGNQSVPAGDLLDPHVDYERVGAARGIRAGQEPAQRSSCNLPDGASPCCAAARASMNVR